MNGEAPLYVLKPSKSRILIPNALKLILLCGIFYAGVLLNVSLLELYIPAYVNILIITTLIVLIALETILTFTKLSKIQYKFYQNRIDVIGPKQQYIMFANVTTVTYKQNIFDKFFGTGTIILGDYKMNAIPRLAVNLDYTKRLIQGFRYQYYQNSNQYFVNQQVTNQ